jgi:hypothetical protein
MNDTTTIAEPAATAAAATTDERAAILATVTPEQVSNAIKAAGAAVTAIEQDGVMRLHSASHGIGFQVLWGSAVAPGQYADFALSCPLRVQGGALPEGVLSDWHRTKRFARVAQHGDFVVLEMDVVVAGGVTPAHLAMKLRLWMQMMGEFFLHLRNYRAPTAAAAMEATAPTAAAAEGDAGF